MLAVMTALLAYSTGWTIAGVILILPWIALVVYALIDLFRSSHYSGGAKAAWVVAIVLFPYIGSISYVVLRGTKQMRSRGM
jgi:uncharacterized membrane protein YhaH (DUF805 family)